MKKGATELEETRQTEREGNKDSLSFFHTEETQEQDFCQELNYGGVTRGNRRRKVETGRQLKRTKLPLEGSTQACVVSHLPFESDTS